MNIKAIKKIASSIFAVAAVLAVLSGCVGRDTQEAAVNVNTSTKASMPTDAETIMHVDALLEELSVRDLIERSGLIVYGEVTEISDPIEIKGTLGNFTMVDAIVEPIEVFRGEKKEKIAVRLDWNMSGGNFVIDDSTPELRLNEKYLLFLHNPGIGGGANTKGDYYYLTGSCQGAFYEVAGDILESEKANSEIVFYNSSRSGEDVSKVVKAARSSGMLDNIDALYIEDTLFSLNGTKTMVDKINKESPYDPDYYRNSAINSLKGNLEREMITQEEYDFYISEIDVYAQVVS